MPTFICEFEDEGVIRSIEIDAEDTDKAIKRMRDMGMDLRRIGTSNGNLEPVPRDEPVEQPKPRERVTISIEAEEEEVLGDPMAAPHPTIDPVSAFPPAPPPLPRTMGDDQHFGAIIEDNIPSEDPKPPEEKTFTVNVRLRNSLLYGPHEEIRKRLGLLLSNEAGRITHFAMHPDMKGNMILGVVVEHEEIVQ
jgi:hypothetical protein